MMLHPPALKWRVFQYIVFLCEGSQDFASAESSVLDVEPAHDQCSFDHEPLVAWRRMRAVCDSAHDWSNAVDYRPGPRDADIHTSHDCRHFYPGLFAFHCGVAEVELHAAHESGGTG